MEKAEDEKMKSIVQLFRGTESREDAIGFTCSCCKKEKSKFVQELWAHSLSLEKYEELIDIGWSRIGCFLDKPDNHKTCCPMYKLRNVIEKFTISKSQLKVLKKFKQKIEQGVDITEPCDSITDKPSIPHETDIIVQNPAKYEINETSSTRLNVTISTSTSSEYRKQKKKHLRRESFQARMISKGLNTNEFTQKVKISHSDTRLEFSDYFKFGPGAKHKFDIKLVKVDVDSPEYDLMCEEEHVIYKKYQLMVHNKNTEECDMARFKQTHCINPFTNETNDMGAFHQQYFLDNALIAVGVLDILPQVVVSAYFFYDPTYSFMNLGTWSVLQELHFLKKLSTSIPSIKYYHLDYYVPKCSKMSYKVNFRPCQLLCPETYKWTNFDTRVDLIIKSVNGGFAKISKDKDTSTSTVANLQKSTDRVLIFQDGVVRKYEDYMESDPRDSRIVNHYLNIVSSSVASDMVLYIP